MGFLQWLNNTFDAEMQWKAPAIMNELWYVPVATCAAYLVVIFGIQRIMKRREAFELNGILAVWNGLLAIFSIVGAYYVMPLMIRQAARFGVTREMCMIEPEFENPWTFLFCLSKFPELIDTLFIVLRKRPLIFLHYYHHVATLLFCWFAWVDKVPNGGWFAAMNLTVHSIMYTYYAMCSLGYRFSTPTRLTITSLQISQMVFGIGITIHNIVACPERGGLILWCGLAMYISYFLLFAKLFRDSLQRSKSSSSTQTKRSLSDSERMRKID